MKALYLLGAALLVGCGGSNGSSRSADPQTDKVALTKRTLAVRNTMRGVLVDHQEVIALVKDFSENPEHRTRATVDRITALLNAEVQSLGGFTDVSARSSKGTPPSTVNGFIQELERTQTLLRGQERQSQDVYSQIQTGRNRSSIGDAVDDLEDNGSEIEGDVFSVAKAGVGILNDVINP